jgi:hypothetical protein
VELLKEYYEKMPTYMTKEINDLRERNEKFLQRLEDGKGGRG